MRTKIESVRVINRNPPHLLCEHPLYKRIVIVLQYRCPEFVHDKKGSQHSAKKIYNILLYSLSRAPHIMLSAVSTFSVLNTILGYLWRRRIAFAELCSYRVKLRPRLKWISGVRQSRFPRLPISRFLYFFARRSR